MSCRRRVPRIIVLRYLIAWLAVLVAWPAQALSDDELVVTRAAEMTGKIADHHPRLLIKSADLHALRSFFNGPTGAAHARPVLLPLDNRPLTPEPAAARNDSAEGARQWRSGWKAADEAGSTALRYALAWLLTENPAYGREAARWLMHLANWRITRDTYRINDELFIQHLRPMIFAYDWAYAALTPGERIAVSRALHERLTILAGFIQPKLGLTRPAPPDNVSHPMRFVSTLGQGGLALLHESAEAPRWLAWSYEYYLRQYPVWGGPAGGWSEGLNYWSTGITQHQRFLEGMALLGFNEPLLRPFWRNTPYYAIYGLMPYAGASFGDLANRMPPSGSIRLLMEKFGRLNADPYPLAFARKLNVKLPTNFSYYTYDAIDSFLEAFRSGQSSPLPANLADLPQSRYFDDIGLVIMHSALGDAAQDIMLGFRASPQGTSSHAFSDQNSFVLNAFGQALAISSGHREYYGSPHHHGWTRQTKSKNAILFGQQGQRVKDANAIGRVVRFADGTNFSFVTGDAVRAYAPHAEKALRHIFFVDRRYFVLLDEMAAPAPVSFQWLLHALGEMRLSPEHGEILVRQQNARLTAKLLHPLLGGLRFSQTDAFDPPVDPGWRASMPNEWHVSVAFQPAQRAEFLAVLYPWSEGSESLAREVRSEPASRGFALRVGQTDLVLMARDNEQRVVAGGWNLDGLAASFSGVGSAQRFALVEATRIEGEWFLKASHPVNLEGERTEEGLSLALNAEEPLSLVINPGFSVRKVHGVSQWERTPDAGVRIDLAAGWSRIDLKR